MLLYLIMNTKTSKILDYILEIGWLLIFFLSPIFFAPFVYSTWQIGEYLLFQILVEVILFAWLVKLILSLGHSVSKNKNTNSLSRFVLPAAVFIFILGLAAVFSQSPYHSFWGYYFRKMGYLIWLHFFVFFLILFFNLKTKKQIARIFYVIAGAVAIAVIYGFLQILGLDPFPWSKPAHLTHRIFSTLGQPNFFGSWLLLSMPIILCLLIKKSVEVRLQQTRQTWKQYFIRPIFISLFLLSVFILVLTQSRGAWFGFFFGFFFFTIIFSWIQNQKRLARLLIVLMSISLIFIFYLNIYPLAYRYDDSFLERRFKTVSHLFTTGKLRLIWWQNSLDLIKNRPILGYGPETQHLNFVRYYIPEFAALEAINAYPDRAHNDILDMLLISGIAGLASYLFLIGMAFWLGLKYIFKNNSQLPLPAGRQAITPITQLTVLSVLTGLLAYLISIQFSFHVIPTAIYFWAYLAIIFKTHASFY